MRGKRIGVFGGTFDPIHIGHLVLAGEARHQLELDRIVLAPAGDPPHKPDSPYIPLASPAGDVPAGSCRRNCNAR